MGKRRSAAKPRLYLNQKNSINVETSERETAPSCTRYCSNVCRALFPFDFNRCFNDCLSCQEDLLFETDHEFYDE
ncbi:hypothetical protein ABFG93_20960 [Pseudalkalibacillus hwajinpoensis]|uniref:hypothetical protein n=1 Tax=Guptibacillus hwajinpoensis TaxID=208199 RepID=UPI00325B4416